jgi:hypothetical protein
LRTGFDARGIRRTLRAFWECCRCRADEPVSLEGTRDALATLVLLDDRRLSGGVRGRMFRVGHENPLARDGGSTRCRREWTSRRSRHEETEPGISPPLVLRSGALIPRAARAGPVRQAADWTAACATSGTSVPLEEERRAPAPPCNLEPLALGWSNTPLDPLAPRLADQVIPMPYPLMA